MCNWAAIARRTVTRCCNILSPGDGDAVTAGKASDRVWKGLKALAISFEASSRNDAVGKIDFVYLRVMKKFGNPAADLGDLALQREGSKAGTECAAINRHGRGNERVLQERNSEPS